VNIGTIATALLYPVSITANPQATMMRSDAAAAKVRNELNRAFDKTRAELDRIEILAAGLAAFNAPIPEYEPTFHHLHRLNLTKHELSSD
jgi:hypothetical protein